MAEATVAKGTRSGETSGAAGTLSGESLDATRTPSNELPVASRTSSGVTPDDTVRRFAKTVVSVEPVDPEDRGYWTPLGHTLEIVPLTNPCEWRAGKTVGVQVVLEGRPWAGVNVHAGHEGGEDSTYEVSTTTDATGFASLTLNRAGHWFLLAELERQAAGNRGAETLRATLTIRVRGEKDVSPGLQAVRAIHGELDPAAVAGYRMGTRALETLGLAAGSGELMVTHWSPLDARFAGAVDGLQAATRTSTGRLSLKWEEAPSSADIQTVCTNRATGQRVVCKMRPALRRMIEATEAAERRDAALRVAVMPDEWVFEVERVGSGGGGGSPTVAFNNGR